MVVGDLPFVPDDIKKFFTQHTLEGLILVSTALLFILLVQGTRRKYNRRTLARTITLWCVYNLAYAVVPAALTIVPANELMSLWASFLFLQLGGPDTFTAYSLEDNELWLRHLAFIVLKSLLVLYVIGLSLPGCSYLLLSVLVFIVGVIKCYERVQALRLASVERLRASLLGPGDPGPDYAKFMEELRLKTSQGFIVDVSQLAEYTQQVIINVDTEDPSKNILEAYRLYKKFEPLFVDLILTYEERDISTSYFNRLDSYEAFRVVEVELGFVYDKVYTKANVVYTYKGLMLRATCIFLILLVLVGFYFLTYICDYRGVDVFITYVVVGASVIKEIFELVTLLRSDWTDLWLNQHNYTRNILIFPFLKQPSKQRWSNAIAQLELLSVAIKEKPDRVLRIAKWFGVDDVLEKQRCEMYTDVSASLKDMIFSQFKEYIGRNDTDNTPLSIHRGSYSLQQNKCITLLWSIDDVEFDQSVLIWHIATSLCYYYKLDDQSGVNRIESNHLSKYMLSLLVSNPDMLPTGIGMNGYRDTCADVKRFFENKGHVTDTAEACINLLRVDCKEVLPSVVTGDRSKTVLFYGVKLAQALMDMNSTEHMWKVISQVWIEMLGYAAANCRASQHSRQLGSGGQLITHVWLLMAHLGLTEHFQVSQGHARAKLNVS